MQRIYFITNTGSTYDIIFHSLALIKSILDKIPEKLKSSIIRAGKTDQSRMGSLDVPYVKIISFNHFKEHESVKVILLQSLFDASDWVFVGASGVKAVTKPYAIQKLIEGRHHGL